VLADVVGDGGNQRQYENTANFSCPAIKAPLFCPP
jgi:hypothetical protein